jgi:hypothetical protein
MDPVAEVVEAAEVAEVEVEKAEVAEVKEVKVPEKPDREPIDRSVPTLDPNFWGNMLQTKREMDKAARSQRYANLVVLK